MSKFEFWYVTYRSVRPFLSQSATTILPNLLTTLAQKHENNGNVANNEKDGKDGDE